MKKLIPLTLALALTACSAPAPNMPAAVGPGTGAQPGTDAQIGTGVGTAAPDAPVVQGRMLSGSAMLGDQPMANAAVSVYVPGGTEAIATATADASGKFELPLEKLSGQSLVKLVATSGELKLVSLYAVPEADKAAYGLFQAGSLTAFQAQLSYSTTLASLSLNSLLSVAAKARLTPAQAAKVYASFNTIATAMQQSLSLQSTVAQMQPLLKSLSPVGEGTISTTLGQQLASQNTALTTALQTALQSVKTLLIQNLPANDPAVLIAQNATVTLGNQTISGSGSGGGSSSGSATAGLRADKTTVTVGDRLILSGASFGTDPYAITLTSTATVSDYDNSIDPRGSGAFRVVRSTPTTLTLVSNNYASLGACTLTVNVNGQAVGSLNLTMAPQGDPIMTGLSTTTAQEGDEVTVTGANLGFHTRVYIEGSGYHADVVRATATSVTFAVPTITRVNPGRVAIEHTHSNVYPQLATPLTVTAGPPRLRTMPVNRVIAGDDITLQGERFAAAIGANVVSFTGTEETASNTATIPAGAVNTATIRVPQSARSGPVTARINGALAVNSPNLLDLTVVPGYRVSERLAAGPYSRVASRGDSLWAVNNTQLRKVGGAPTAITSAPADLVVADNDVVWLLDYTGNFTRVSGSVELAALPASSTGSFNSRLKLDNLGRPLGLICVSGNRSPFPTTNTLTKVVEEIGGSLTTSVVLDEAAFQTAATTANNGVAVKLYTADMAVDANNDVWIIASGGNSTQPGILYRVHETSGTYGIAQTVVLPMSTGSVTHRVFCHENTVFTITPTVGGQRVQRYSLAGALVGTAIDLPGEATSYQNLAVDAAGDLVFASNGQGLKRITATGITDIAPLTAALGNFIIDSTGFWGTNESGEFWHITPTTSGSL